MSALTFWQLPDVLKSTVYEYDDTYKRIMKNVVLVDLWRTCWVGYRNNMKCPYCKVVLDHLFNSWGVWEDTYYCGIPTDINWFKKKYFPDNFKFVVNYCGDFCRNMGISVRVYSPKGCVFNGWVLNESEEKETVWIENDEVSIFNAVEVHWDILEKLYVWQRHY